MSPAEVAKTRFDWVKNNPKIKTDIDIFEIRYCMQAISSKQWVFFS